MVRKVEFHGTVEVEENLVHEGTDPDEMSEEELIDYAKEIMHTAPAFDGLDQHFVEGLDYTVSEEGDD